MIGLIHLNTFDVCIEYFHKTGYYKYWKAIDVDCDDYNAAFELAHAVAICEPDVILNTFEKWFHKYVIAAGIEAEEYWEAPATPLWKDNKWKWNEETEEWEKVMDDD